MKNHTIEYKEDIVRIICLLRNESYPYTLSYFGKLEVLCCVYCKQYIEHTASSLKEYIACKTQFIDSLKKEMVEKQKYFDRILDLMKRELDYENNVLKKMHIQLEQII